MSTEKTGQWGEEKAVQFLLDNGYEVLETNWRYKHLEIDIIALYEKAELVVVEVKTRKQKSIVSAEYAVTKSKQEKLIKAANQYVKQKCVDLPIRFDIITIVYTTSKMEVNHIKDAFYPLL